MKILRIKVLIAIVFLLSICSSMVRAQIKVVEGTKAGIGTDNPEQSAILNIEDKTRGFLKPRMTNTQMSEIESPATGLEVYNTTMNQTYYYNGLGWIPYSEGLNTFIIEGDNVDVWQENSPLNPYRVALEGFDNRDGENMAISLIHCDEIISDRHAFTTLESPALKTFTLPATGYKGVIVEYIAISGAVARDEFGSQFVDFTWRIKDLVNNTTIKEHQERSQLDLIGETGNFYTNTLSAYIDLEGELAGNDIGITVTLSQAQVSIYGQIGAFRVYGLKSLEGSAPKGKTGPQGPKGDKGPIGLPGSQGPNGDPGPNNSLTPGIIKYVDSQNTASVSIVGQGPSQTINVSIPNGQDGVDGRGGIATSGSGITILNSGDFANPYEVSSLYNGTLESINGELPVHISNPTTNPNLSINNGGLENGKFALETIENNKFSNKSITPQKLIPGFNNHVLYSNGVTVDWKGILGLGNQLGWRLGGNDELDHKLGTNNSVDLSIITNNTEKLSITGEGRLYTHFENQDGSIVDDIIIGKNAHTNNLGGEGNVIIGEEANKNFLNNTPGQSNYNTIVGSHAGSGTYNSLGNTFVGYRAGYHVNGNKNVLIGKDAGYYTTTNQPIYELTNAIGIGNQANPTNSHYAHFGNVNVSEIGGPIDWTDFSDQRIKKDITSNVPGMSFISLLRPVQYNTNAEKHLIIANGDLSERDLEGEAQSNAILHSGLIAQEVEAAAQQIGYDFSGVVKPKHEHDLYSISYAQFVAPMVKAIQEQNEEITGNANLIESLENENNRIQNLINENVELIAELEAYIQSHENK